MMLIICDKEPQKAVKYLVDHTNNQFVFKQLLELGQLVSSSGISKVFKRVVQGKELQKWILRNPNWTCSFYNRLLIYCLENVNMKDATVVRLSSIFNDLKKYSNGKSDLDDTIVFRYKEDYEDANYSTNSYVPINEGIAEYRKYIDWKYTK